MSDAGMRHAVIGSPPIIGVGGHDASGYAVDNLLAGGAGPAAAAGHPGGVQAPSKMPGGGMPLLLIILASAIGNIRGPTDARCSGTALSVSVDNADFSVAFA